MSHLFYLHENVLSSYIYDIMWLSSYMWMHNTHVIIYVIKCVCDFTITRLHEGGIGRSMCNPIWLSNYMAMPTCRSFITSRASQNRWRDANRPSPFAIATGTARRDVRKPTIIPEAGRRGSVDSLISRGSAAIYTGIIPPR